MKIINDNNDHLKTHRYGWTKIMAELCEKVTKDNILLVDFMDRYFNSWYEEDKIISCNNNIYQFKNNDSYYHYRDDNKSDVFVYSDELNNKHFIKWFPNYNEFKLLRGERFSNFIKKYKPEVLYSKWIGFLHYPEFLSEMNFQSGEELKNIINTQIFKESVKNCMFIIVLSNTLKIYCDKLLLENNINIDVKVLLHPTEFNCKKFTYAKFIKNKRKKIIQIGFWLRKIDTIFKIKTKYEKLWLPGGHQWKDMLSKIYKNKFSEYLNDDMVKIELNVSNDTYDKLLEENIVLINVFNSSANNTILECISRNTPIIASKHSAIIEYLGENYPFYFETEDELNNIINSPIFDEMVLNATNYLKNMNKKQFYVSSFINQFKKIIKII